MPNASLQAHLPARGASEGASGGRVEAGPFAPSSGNAARRAALIAGWIALATLVLLALTGGASRAVQLDLGYSAENLVPPEELVGEWLAMIQERNLPQPVTLRIVDVTPGKTAGKITYSSPRRCVVDLEYGGAHEGRHIFYIIRFTNCFEYEDLDFVAISKAPAEAPAPGEAAMSGEAAAPDQNSAAEPDRPENVSAESKEAKEDAVSNEAESGDAPEPPKRIDRIRYAINLSGKDQESSIMVRQ